MKGFLIGIDNERFEAEIVRYFQNVNDRYLIYTKNEKDANGFILLYATKIISDNGIKIGENITDENEWALVKNFLKQTVSENKEGKPVTINDCNPAEINELKINAQKPFKLPESAVEMFGKNKKSFEIVQQMAAEQNVVKVPVPPETVEFVQKEETPIVPDLAPVSEEIPSASDFGFDIPSPVQVSNVEQPVEVAQPTVFEPTPVEPSPIENTPVEPTPVVIQTENSGMDYESLYKSEVEKSNNLMKEIETLVKDNAEYKSKLDKLKELLG